jgi:enoyl-CoA hydratase
MLASSKPIIGAINGHVRAGGMGFVGCCDFVVAGPKATFGLSEVRIGVVAAVISAPVLSRLGDRVASEWMLRGGAVSVTEAAAAGFITRAVDGEATTVEQAVEEILVDLRKAAPHALAVSKKIANRRVLDRYDRDLEEMLDISVAFFLGDDAKAGIAAFMQKTSPPWAIDA